MGTTNLNLPVSHLDSSPTVFVPSSPLTFIGYPTFCQRLLLDIGKALVKHFVLIVSRFCDLHDRLDNSDLPTDEPPYWDPYKYSFQHSSNSSRIIERFPECAPDNSKFVFF